jgi:glycosyltransferase involved in cell wall biosynthesis
VRLARDFAITLISFEKEPPDHDLNEHLKSLGIRWRPLRYHKRPPVGSTAWDIVAGARAIDRELRRVPDSILHTRSYVATEMVMRAPRARHSPLLFDIRGFWIDERVDGGAMRKGALYRYARGRERRFYTRADAIVTLTDASTEVIRQWTAGREVPIAVIPTCTEIARFATTSAAPERPRLVWMGSVGIRCRLDLAHRLSQISGLPLAVYTPQVAEAQAQVGDDAAVRYVPPADVPAALRAGDIGLCLYRLGSNMIAAAPTRFAEFLAAGVPIAVTTGVGDLERIVEQKGLGCVLRDEDDSALRATAGTLAEMAMDPDTRDRCRAVAKRFDVEDGARRYAALYRSLLDRATTAQGHSSLTEH